MEAGAGAKRNVKTAPAREPTQGWLSGREVYAQGGQVSDKSLSKSRAGLRISPPVQFIRMAGFDGYSSLVEGPAFGFSTI